MPVATSDKHVELPPALTRRRTAVMTFEWQTPRYAPMERHDIRPHARFMIARAAALPILTPAFAFLIVLTAFGCNRTERPSMSVDLDVIAVSSADLGVPENSAARPGEHPLDTTRTTGRFPAGLAVARVVTALDEPTGRRRLRPGEMSVDRAAHWNQVMDTLPPVREVTLLRELGIDPRGVESGDFLREATRINCNLCLLFGRTENAEGEAALLGVLWDSAEMRPLAAFLSPILIEAEIDEKNDKPEARIRAAARAEMQAEQELRAMVRNTIWDLVKRDETVSTTQPSPWRGDDALMPRDRDPLRRIEEMLKQQQGD